MLLRESLLLPNYQMSESALTYQQLKYINIVFYTKHVDGLRNRRKRICTPVALLRSLSGKYPWERYEPPYPPSCGLNSTTPVLLGEWLWH